jgi:hypothetical protein
VLRIDRLERRVLRLESDASLLSVERLDRRLVRGLVVTGERNDDVAVSRLLRATHDDEVAVEDAGLESPLTRSRKSPRRFSGTASSSSMF